MKKMISVLLAAAMLLSLAACASKTTSVTGSDDASVQTEASRSSAETAPELPGSEAPAMADGETPPEKPGSIQTTGGGTTNAENLTVTTSGNSSAATARRSISPPMVRP